MTAAAARGAEAKVRCEAEMSGSPTTAAGSPEASWIWRVQIGREAARQGLASAYAREDGSAGSFRALARIDGPTELTYIHNGGILPTVLRRLYKESAGS